MAGIGKDLKDWKPLDKKLYEGYKVEVKTLNVIDLKTASSEKGLMRNEDDRKDIDKFSKRMSEGRRFPLIEVAPRRSGGYSVTDGNHRFLAYKQLGKKTIPAVVILETAMKLVCRQ